MSIRPKFPLPPLDAVRYCPKHGMWNQRGSTVAADPVGHLLALHVPPADEQDRTQVGTLAKAVQTVTGKHVEPAYVDQGYTGNKPAYAARHMLKLEVSKLAPAKRGFVLLPRRWVVGAPSTGPRASFVFPATTNGSPPPSAVFIG